MTRRIVSKADEGKLPGWPEAFFKIGRLGTPFRTKQLPRFLEAISGLPARESSHKKEESPIRCRLIAEFAAACCCHDR